MTMRSWCWRTWCCIIVVVLLLPCRGERTLSDHEKLVLEDMLLKAYGKTWKERSDEKKEVAKYTNIVIECSAKEQLVFISLVVFITV